MNDKHGEQQKQLTINYKHSFFWCWHITEELKLDDMKLLWSSWTELDTFTKSGGEDKTLLLDRT